MELERVVIGLVAALLLPYSVPPVRPRPLLALPLTVLYAAYALAPVLPSPATAVLLPLTAAASWGLWRLARTDAHMQGSPRILISRSVAGTIFAPLGLTAALAVTAAALHTGTQVLTGARDLILDDRTAITVSGLLIATFIGGEVVTHTLHPFYAELKKAEAEEMEPLKGAGTAIGWLERSMTYALTVAGRPEAIVVVVGIKALARFPELQSNQKRFAEYFLIGSMSSIGLALLIAAVIRIVLGEKALG
ncbi:hypothetical protein O4J56_15660 [Nocardiopsis sp. RSe5-2]|uniref:Uncharacterized protein n=1 Tax=Nocardiopsis endophytica TaxID=3018445 RepID=A0ABT4U563_9ACTN|nr:hypothetical protein [Nocardiopsis endophytica]MDA2812080.1 hypothetical protein [Nocardiopsis endophytica]